MRHLVGASDRYVAVLGAAPGSLRQTAGRGPSLCPNGTRSATAPAGRTPSCHFVLGAMWARRLLSPAGAQTQRMARHHFRTSSRLSRKGVKNDCARTGGTVGPNYVVVDGLVPLKSPVRPDPTTVVPRPIDGPVFRVVCATASVPSASVETERGAGGLGTVRDRFSAAWQTECAERDPRSMSASVSGIWAHG